MIKEYISKEEYKKGKRVVELMKTRLAEKGICITEAVRFGFVVLDNYSIERGFETVVTFTKAD